MRSRVGRGRATGPVTLRSVSARLITAVTVVAGALAAGPPAAAADLPYGPYTCANGFVWREAFAGDQVCVPPAIRSQSWSENALGPSRREPNGGPYGPDTCKQGFVWREARPSDRVCVPPPSRDQARSDNANAPWRLADAGATPQGGITAITAGHSAGGHLYAAGSGVSPYGAVKFFAARISAGPFPLGTLTATPSGTLPAWQYVANIGCWAGETRLATIVVLDQASGLVTTAGTTDAFRRCG
ncbi:hypothetical protein ACFYXL_26420 [Streptomyces tsukubensis]|uniref:hypothetical protein n=1 Tax=Streptomyces tsukubensis TaxID=83656 RepID=UPI0036AEA97E